MASRISSASSRWTVRFQSKRFSGSTRCAAASSLAAALGRLAIGRRGQDQPVQRLEVPALSHEFGRQPVEQLGMAGRLAQAAEVARRARQPPPEMVLPDPVDDHPGRKRIVRPAQPAGQGQPPPGRLRRPRARLDPAAAGSSTDGNPGSIGFSAALARNHGRRRDRPDVGHRQHRLRRNRPQGVERLELLLQLVPPRLWPAP